MRLLTAKGLEDKGRRQDESDRAGERRGINRYERGDGRRRSAWRIFLHYGVFPSLTDFHQTNRRNLAVPPTVGGSDRFD